MKKAGLESHTPAQVRAEWLTAAALAAAIGLIDWQIISFFWRNYFKIKASPEYTHSYLAWSYTHEAWKSAVVSTAMFGFFVLVGAITGTLFALRKRHAPVAQRVRSAMVGAVVIHALLPVVLMVSIASHPLNIPW